MPEDDFLSTAKIAIFGLGLMGGSLALALRGKCAALYGIDQNPDALSLALGRGVVDKATRNPSELLPEADVIVLAAPVTAILDLIAELPRLHTGGVLVLDLGSTKKEIAAAMAHLPTRFEALGGHPICGKEKSGLENADARLYQGAPFVLTALPGAADSIKAKAQELVRAVGARPLWLDAETHDRMIAYTSHLPYLLALALALSAPSEVASLVGPGFRSTSRVAATPASVMLDILKTNRLNLLEALEAYRGSLDRLESGLIGEDWSALEQLMNSGAAHLAELSAEAVDKGGKI